MTKKQKAELRELNEIIENDERFNLMDKDLKNGMFKRRAELQLKKEQK